MASFLSSNTQDFIEVKRVLRSLFSLDSFLSSNTQDFIEVTSFKDKKSAEIATFLSSNTQDFIEVQCDKFLK